MVESWRDRARCRGMSHDTFFPHYKGLNALAVTICNGIRAEGQGPCPVLNECLEAALATRLNEDFGIWGGTDRNERQRIRKARARQKRKLDKLSEWRDNA